jgi:hypothetical protein
MQYACTKKSISPFAVPTNRAIQYTTRLDQILFHPTIRNSCHDRIQQERPVIKRSHRLHDLVGISVWPSTNFNKTIHATNSLQIDCHYLSRVSQVLFSVLNAESEWRTSSCTERCVNSSSVIMCFYNCRRDAVTITYS